MMIRALAIGLQGLTLLADCRKVKKEDKAKKDRRDRIKKQGHGENFMKAVFGLTHINQKANEETKLSITKIYDIPPPAKPEKQAKKADKKPAEVNNPIIGDDDPLNNPIVNPKGNPDPPVRPGKGEFKVGDKVYRKGSTNGNWQDGPKDPEFSVVRVADCKAQYANTKHQFVYEANFVKKKLGQTVDPATYFKDGEKCYGIAKKPDAAEADWYWYRGENVKKVGGGGDEPVVSKGLSKGNPVSKGKDPVSKPKPIVNEPEPVLPPVSNPGGIPAGDIPGAAYKIGDEVIKYSTGKAAKGQDPFSDPRPWPIAEVRKCADLSDEEKKKDSEALGRKKESPNWMPITEDHDKTDGVCYAIQNGKTLMWYREDRLKLAPAGPKPPVRRHSVKPDNVSQPSVPGSVPGAGGDTGDFKSALKGILGQLSAMPAEQQDMILPGFIQQLGLSDAVTNLGGMDALKSMIASNPDMVIDFIDSSASPEVKQRVIQMAQQMPGR